MPTEFDISALSPSECVLLAQQLWDRARTHPGTIPVTTAQMEELARRNAAFDRGELPPGMPWEEVDAWLAQL